jgi:hypothetical protein
MERELAALRQKQEKEQDFSRIVEETLVFLEEDELTEDVKDKFIDNVIVYEEERIEVRISVCGMVVVY